MGYELEQDEFQETEPFVEQDQQEVEWDWDRDEYQPDRYLDAEYEDRFDIQEF